MQLVGLALLTFAMLAAPLAVPESGPRAMAPAPHGFVVPASAASRLHANRLVRPVPPAGAAGNPASTSANDTVRFVETGLPRGVSWSVVASLGSLFEDSISDRPEQSVAGPAGNCSYEVTAHDFASTPMFGTVALGNLSTNISVSFAPESTYSAAFRLVGLPAGVAWSLTFGGVWVPGYVLMAGSTFNDLPDGTYSFAVGPPDGYSVNPSSGSLTVHGGNASQLILFTTPPAAYLGLSLVDGYAILVGVIAAVAVGAGLTIFLVDRKRAHSEPAKTPTEPDEGAPPLSP